MELIYLITISVIITSILAVVAIIAHPKKWHDLSLAMSIIVIIVQISVVILSLDPTILEPSIP